MSLAEELSMAAYLDAPGKAELYNSLLDAGYSDAQIRAQADQMFGDQSAYWSQLTDLAQSLRQQPLPAEPAGLMSQGTGMAQNNPNLLESLFAQMTPAEFNNYSMMREIGVNEMIPLTTIGGKSYFQNSDGSIVEIERTGEIGANQTIYSPEGQVVEQANLPNYNASNPVTNAFVGGVLGLGLGLPALGLSAPTAAAIAAGAPRLNETGSLTEAAKAAALAGLTAYGAESLAGSFANKAYDTAFAAADAAQLANQGLSATQIAQNLSTYVDPSVAASLANTAANQAFALADATQLAKQGISVNQIEQVLTSSGVSPTTAANMASLAVETISLNPNAVPGISAADIVPDLQFQKTRGESGKVTTSPGAVEVTGSRLADTALQTAAATGGGLLGGTVATLPSTAPSPNRVEVPGSRLPTENLTLDDLLAVLSPAITGALPPVTGGGTTIPTQQVTTTGTRDVTTPTSPSTVGGATGGLFTQPIVTTTAPTQQVTTTGSRVEPTMDTSTVGGATGSILGQAIAPTQQVTTTGTRDVTTTEAPSSAGGAIGSVLAPTQTVETVGTRSPATTEAPSTVGGAVGSVLAPTATAPTQTVETTGVRDTTTGGSAAAGGALGSIISSIQPAIPTAPERVEVTGKKDTEVERVTPLPSVVAPVLPPALTQPLPQVTQPPAQPTESLFSPSDILKLLALLGSGAAAGGAGGGGSNVPVRGLPPSDTMIGSTTPQFGSDYYAAVQRYYNAFMPETPRNVSGPLQQWYENKFGA